ncbi:Piwi domain containing protein [Pyrenophora teres f. teres]|uniref:Piwi domain containing protein n=1 Tax=Pyrenophora teres f. teres TaxID=97479 RepID=A0A6S6W0V8_9PLEO|nr:hypothetical protein PTNB29_04021 [Pyrenophora teres f. teres]CAE7032959.1 Piwi domain containing protein [Pyrenophora teres f. teres]
MLLQRTTNAIDDALKKAGPPCGRCGGQHALAMCPADASVGRKGAIWVEMGKGAHETADAYLKKHPGYKYVARPAASGGGGNIGSGGKANVGGKNWGGFKNSGAGAKGAAGPGPGNTPAIGNKAANDNHKFGQQRRGFNVGYAPPNSVKQNVPQHIRGSEYVNSTPTSDMYYPHKGNLSQTEKKPNDNGKAWYLHQELRDQISSRQQLDPQFAIRQNFFPKTGDQKVLTNHFEYEIDADTIFYEYKILDLNMKNRKKARTLIKTAIKDWTFLAQNEDFFATNYFDTIVSWKPLHLNLDEGTYNEDEGSTDWYQSIAVGKDNLAVRFRFVKKIPIHNLERYAAGDPSYESVNFDNIAACLNLVISKSFNNQVHKLSANKFFVKSARVPLSAGPSESDSLEIIRGYFYNVKPGMGNIILNFNLSTSAAFRPVLVADFLHNNNTFGTNANTILIGKNVYVDAERYHDDPEKQKYFNSEDSRYWKVSQLSQKNIEALTFFRQKMLDGQPVILPNETADTEEIYVIDYLEQVFQRRPIPGRPAVNVGPGDRPVWYAQEHLRIVPYQPYTKPVPDKFTSSMVNEACRAPELSRAYIENEGLKSIGFSIGANAVAFNNIPLRLHPTMLQVPYTQLKFPQALYGPANRPNPAQQASRWAWPRNPTSMFYKTVANTETLKYVIVATQGCDRTTPVWYDNYIKKHIKKCGLSPQQATRISVDRVTPFLTSNCESVLQKKLTEAVTHGAKLFILVLEKYDTTLYRDLKNLADRVAGIQSLCVVQQMRGDEKFWGDLMTNIMMKLNLKLGGINHVVDAVQTRLGNHTMVLGADLVHPSGNLPGVPSIASIVGSVENHAGKCLGSMRLQSIDRTNREIMDAKSVIEMVTERLHAWADAHTGLLPASIIYYRDGVSAGHYAKVQEEELTAIRAAYAAVRKTKGMKPQALNLTAVIVTKRHHTRFYPTANGEKDRWGNKNCMPGTCVDQLVTSPYYQDFYLQSHSGIKGTARPTHYFVLENNVPGLTLEALRDLTHNLSYSYVRSMTPVSYVPPTYYADRLCERGRLYMRRFFVGDDPTFRMEVDAYRDKLRAQLKAKRKDEVDDGKDGKIGKEQMRKRMDEDTVKKDVEKWVFGKVKEEFNRHGDGGGGGGDVGYGNPWGRELGKTMFWM